MGELIFTVVGGLGIFLLGMRNMSDGLQAIAGPSLRRMIGMVTDNRFLAVGVGTLVTCLVQSSSITTVMVVGFVNSGLMALNQAIGVVMGANIGTTITGWVLVLKVGKYGLPILGVGAFFLLFSKRERVRYIAMAVMGIGMVFFGLELMKNGFKPIRTMPAFEAWFREFSADSYFGVLRCAFVGCVLTVIVQSSSATLAITIALALNGALTFETAAALVLGENIGTTITAFLASIGANANARRAAYFHVVFNLIGVLWITAIFRLYLPLIRAVVSTFFGIDDLNAPVVDESGAESFPHTTAGIATVHTVFNVANVLLFLPLIGFFARLLERRVSDKPKKEKRYLTNLDFQMYDSPFAAIEQGRAELVKMKQSTRAMLDELKEFLADPTDRQDLSTRVFQREETLDTVQKEITVFLTDALSGQLSHDLTEEAKDQIRICDEYESVSDYITQVLKLRLRIREGELDYSEEQNAELSGLHERVEKYFDLVTGTGDEKQVLERSEAEGERINDHVRSLRSRHWDRLAHEESTPLVSTTYSDALHSYRKIKEHLLNIAEVRAGEK